MTNDDMLDDDKIEKLAELLYKRFIDQHNDVPKDNSKYWHESYVEAQIEDIRRNYRSHRAIIPKRFLMDNDCECLYCGQKRFRAYSMGDINAKHYECEHRIVCLNCGAWREVY